MAHSQNTKSLAQFDKFPPTVVDHTEYDDGLDLHLLDSGTQEEPRVIQVFNDDRDPRFYL